MAAYQISPHPLHRNLMIDIGSPIRTARHTKRLTQAEVANAIGVSRQALAMLETNRGRVATLARFENFMRVHVTGLKPEKSLIAEIRSTRLRAKLSLREMAKRANVSVNTLRGLENGSGSIASLLTVLRALSPRGDVRVAALSQRRRALVTVARDPIPTAIRTTIIRRLPLLRGCCSITRSSISNIQSWSQRSARHAPSISC